MNEMLKAYHEAMKKYELGYEKIRAYTEEDIKRELDSRAQTIAEIRAMGWSPRNEQRMVDKVTECSEELVKHYRQTAEETISRARKNDSALVARLLGIPDPLANS